MMRFIRCFFFIFLLPACLWAQQIPAPKVEIGPDEISMNQKLTVTITVYGKLDYVEDLPEFAGFIKGNKTTRHNEVKIDGERVPVHTIVKNFIPIEGGEFLIPAFDLDINKQTVKVESKMIKVMDDEESFTDINRTISSAEFVLECSKREIFVGEGVKIRLSFYLSEGNAANWQFAADISRQVEAIAKKVKPENTLENRNIISSIPMREEYIKGVRYFVYDIFEAVYYPLNNKEIVIPALSLTMNRGEGKAVLKSQSQIIRVKELPSHPQKDKVPVGSLRIRQELNDSKPKSTGKSFDFSIVLEGQGHFNDINLNKPVNDKDFDFYEANVDISQAKGKVSGSKRFTYKILPKVAGDFNIGSYFNLVYFDIKTRNYDTLRLNERVVVTGETIDTKESFTANIYRGIEELETDSSALNLKRIFKGMANVLLVLMVFVLIFIWKKNG